MEKEEVKAPQGTAFILTVPLDREGKNKATFFLKEMDEETFMAAKAYTDAKKDFEAVRFMINALSLEGSAPITSLKGNFIAVNSATKKVLEIINPLDAELKKN